jgi:hypothetical protein
MEQMLPRRLRRLPSRTRDDGLVVLTARGFRARLLGLAFLRDLPPGYALLIPRCRSVHTFGMRFALDLVWLGERGEALRADRAVGRRQLRRCRRARAVLELAARADEPPQPHRERRQRQLLRHVE